MTGSGIFIEYISAGRIHIAYTSNGTETDDFAVPSGSFRGMESDNSGENLAVFTSTFITLYQTGNFTCNLEQNCGDFSGVDDDDTPGESQSSSGSSTGTGKGSVPDWLLPTVLIYAVAMIIAAVISYRLGRGNGIVYGIFTFLATIVSIFFAGMPWYIPLILIVLPALAVIIWKGPWSSR